MALTDAASSAKRQLSPPTPDLSDSAKKARTQAVEPAKITVTDDYEVEATTSVPGGAGLTGATEGMILTHQVSGLLDAFEVMGASEND